MAQALRAAFQAGNYALGVTLFQALRRPRAEHYRLAGRCYLHLSQTLPARQLLLRAAQRGLVAARIDAATCLRMDGDLNGALQELQGLESAQLNVQDTAGLLREQAILHSHLGQMEEAIVLGQRAWASAVAAPLSVQANVAYTLANLLCSTGRDLQAEAYLDFAQQHTSPHAAPYVALAQARAKTCLGRFAQARDALTLASQLSASLPLIQPVIRYHEATWYRAQGQWDSAREQYTQCVTLARDVRQSDTECYAELGLVALAVQRDDLCAAHTHLARAAFLAPSPRARAYVAWRRGRVRRMQQDQGGIDDLQEAWTYFQQQGGKREALWLSLHLAEAYLTSGQQDQARQTLHWTAQTHLALDRQQCLWIELRSLPLTVAFLKSLGDDALEHVLLEHGEAGITTGAVRLVTFGEPAIYVNGQRARLQLRRSIEVLVYLLRTGPVGLAQLRRDLFTDIPASRAKNYLHQVRLELGRLLPGLSVPYDPQHRTYTLKLEGVELKWDVQALQLSLSGPEGWRRLTAQMAPVNFLAQSEGEWVLSERVHLSRWIIRVGLDTLESLYRSGRYEDVHDLAERLIEIEPLESALHVFLLRATAEAAGIRAALVECHQCQATFRQEVGEVPSVLKALEQEWQTRVSN